MDIAATRIIVVGASNQVAFFLLPKLLALGAVVMAVSRNKKPLWFKQHEGIIWIQQDLRLRKILPKADVLIHMGPIDIAPFLIKSSFKKVICFSTASVLFKKNSSNQQECRLIETIITQEENIIKKSNQCHVDWLIIRPTMIYGCGLDKNLTFIANFIMRWGFFPLLNHANGLRQPVHANDLALACIKLLELEEVSREIILLSGGECVTYKTMVERIFLSLNKTARITSFPAILLRFFCYCVRMLPKFRLLHWEMMLRMRQDLSVDSTRAWKRINITPKLFKPEKELWTLYKNQ